MLCCDFILIGGFVFFYDFYYFFFVILDKVWVSDIRNNFILKNIVGGILYYIMDLYNGDGVYIVNSMSELIYIDREYGIKKLFKDRKMFIIFINNMLLEWKLLCVYWLFFIEDLLVGMVGKFVVIVDIGIVIRYN